VTTEHGSADGAWGLRFPQISEGTRVLMNAPDWRPVNVEVHRNVDDLRIENDWDDRGMRVPLPAGGYLEVAWPVTISLSLPGDPTPDSLVQPHLSTAAGAIAMRSGQQPFHAGAFVVDGRAWGVLGERNSGKSSTLALADKLDLTVLTDDLLVVDNGSALAGPRCLDLRGEAAHVLGIGVDLGTVGTRERWRVYLGDAPLAVPMGGWILPRWGARASSVSAPVSRLQAILRQSFIQGITMNDPSRYLDLAALPLISWARPKVWSLAELSFRHLLRRIAEF
jgi:hypothetical protein